MPNPQVVDEDGEKLAMEREEHRAVAELTRKEQDYVQALKEVSDWKRLSLLGRTGKVLGTGRFWESKKAVTILIKILIWVIYIYIYRYTPKWNDAQ